MFLLSWGAAETMKYTCVPVYGGDTLVTLYLGHFYFKMQSLNNLNIKMQSLVSWWSSTVVIGV